MSETLDQLLDRFSVSADEYFLDDFVAEFVTRGPEVIPALRERYPAAIPPARHAIVRTFIKLGDPVVVPFLVQSWEREDDSKIRDAIEWALVELGAKDEAVEICLRALSQEDDDEAEATIAFLADFAPSTILPELEEVAERRRPLRPQVAVARLRLQSGFSAVAKEHRMPSGEYEADAVGIAVYCALPRPEVLQVIKEDLESYEPVLVFNAAQSLGDGLWPREIIDDGVKTILLDLLGLDVPLEARGAFLSALIEVIGPEDTHHLTRLRTFAEEKPYRSKWKLWRRGEEDTFGIMLADAIRVIERRNAKG